jgi:CheY-like chemotaxis protein
VVRWFGTNTDVTELRQLQEELKAADRRKDEFLAMLAHELRNPVAPIVSATEVLRHLAADEGQRSMLDLVQRQAKHLSRLLDDLLDVARISQGRIELKREVVDLRTCLEMALDTANHPQEEQRSRMLIEQSADPLQVRADIVRMAQCLGNLVSNARKFTPADGSIRIQSFRDGADAVVEIADSGIGIAAELLPHIFGLFVQGERTLDRSQGGLGIGLAICRQVMDLHGGSIVAASAGLGCGSTFTVCLPLIAIKPPIEGKRSSSIASGRNVLIVDDNRDAADSLALLLQFEGHATTAVYSSEQALETMQILKPQVVVLDIGLPGMDGYEVARRLRLIAPEARLIALTGYGRPEDRLRAKEAGFDVHLVKPVASADFNEAIAAPVCERLPVGPSTGPQ